MSINLKGGDFKHHNAINMERVDCSLKKLTCIRVDTSWNQSGVTIINY